MTKQLKPDESPSFPLHTAWQKHSVAPEKLDGVASLRALIGGALRGLAEKYNWGAQEAAKAMGASDQHAEQILSSRLSGIPLEVLVDMAVFAGIELQLSFKLPKP